MHILIVTDQHPDSLGGAQVAIRAQRAALESLGHSVTIAAPELHRSDYEVGDKDRDAYVGLPSRSITRDNEYGLSWPTRRTDRALAAALRMRPAVDLVHVQGDFWGAMIGVRAARGLKVPLVFTLHNNVDEGTRAVTPAAPAVFAALRFWRGLSLGHARGEVSKRSRGAWRYLAELTAEADAVIAPSAHFAAQLERHGVYENVQVVRGGVDDALISKVATLPRSERTRPRLVWLGRMSGEKRVIEFIEAISQANLKADVRLFGAGLLLEKVRTRIDELDLHERVEIVGPVSHEQALIALRDADALVQTSIGFETQGLTPFEAAALGTPTVFCDHAIAQDIEVEPQWVVQDASVEALAEALELAVQEITAQHEPVRVGTEHAGAFLQSEQTKLLVKIYESVLA